MSLDSLQNGVTNAITNNPLAATVIAGGAGLAVGAAAGVAIGAIANKKTKSKRTRKKRARIKHTKRGWKQDRKRRSKQPWEVAYRRKKRKSKRSSRVKRRKGLHYTKKGQPYIILSSGKAKFVKKTKRRSK